MIKIIIDVIFLFDRTGDIPCPKAYEDNARPFADAGCPPSTDNGGVGWFPGVLIITRQRCGTGDRSVSRLDSFDSFYPWLKKS